MKPSMLAAIDVGSNAIRFLISNVEELSPDKPVKKMPTFAFLSALGRMFSFTGPSQNKSRLPLWTP